MNSFQNISITLPHEKNRENVFYSTSKKRSQDHRTDRLDFTKDQFLRQLSCKSNNNKTVFNYDLKAQTLKLQHKLNQKNDLLVKQSRWKNYYFKEEICTFTINSDVLTQDILEYLNLMSSEISEYSYFHQYAKKLEKIIAKVEVKKTTQKNWIQFIGIQNFQNEKFSKSVQTQDIQIGNYQSFNEDLIFQKELVQVQEDNKQFLKNLNILTQQIQNKQKEIIHWQQKYSKLKQKKNKLKNEYILLQTKFQQLVINKQHHLLDLQKTENFSRKKHNKNASHFHTYSCDKNDISKSKFCLHSQQNCQKIETESSKLFVLSDTPFIQQKYKDIPISKGFEQTQKKLEIKIDQNPRDKSRNSVSIMTNKSEEKIISLMDRQQSLKSNLPKKNKTQYENINSLEVNKGQIPTNSLICESQGGLTDLYRQLILSQAITIENLLDSVF